MGILNTLSSYFTRATPQNDTIVPLSKATPDVLFGALASNAEYINHNQSLTVTAYYAALRTISEEIGAFPRHLFRKDKSKGRIDITDSALGKLLNNPNPILYTAYSFWQTYTRHALQYGNGYAEIIKAGAEPIKLQLIHPTRVKPFLRNQQLVYEVKADSGTTYLTGDRVLHLVAFSDDGMVGIDPLSYHAVTLNTGRFASRFTASYFENGANPTGVIKHPGALSKEAGERLRSQFQTKYTGIENSHKPMLLEEGMSFEPLSVDPEKSQLIELKKYNVEDIARIFRIPLSKLQSNEKANYNSLEAENIAFVTETLLPWCRKIEAEIQRKLVPLVDADTVYMRFSIDGRARGTLAERNAAYAAGRNGGWLSVNDIRESEDLTRIDGGDTYLSPLNMAPTAAPNDKPTEEKRSVSTDKNTYLPLVESITRSLATKEAKALQTVFKARESEDRANNYSIFNDKHKELVRSKYEPLIKTASSGGVELPDIASVYLDAAAKQFASNINSTKHDEASYIDNLVEAVITAYRS
jgi:HK97 family phage portal protein